MPGWRCVRRGSPGTWCEAGQGTRARTRQGPPLAPATLGAPTMTKAPWAGTSARALAVMRVAGSGIAWTTRGARGFRHGPPLEREGLDEAPVEGDPDHHRRDRRQRQVGELIGHPDQLRGQSMGGQCSGAGAGGRLRGRVGRGAGGGQRRRRYTGRPWAVGGAGRGRLPVRLPGAAGHRAGGALGRVQPALHRGPDPRRPASRGTSARPPRSNRFLSPSSA